MHEQWARFNEDVDDVVPLAVRATSVNLQPNWCDVYSTVELMRKQRADNDLCHVIKWLKDGSEPSDKDLWLQGAESKKVWLNRSLMELNPDGLLLFRWEKDEVGVRKCLVVPSELVQECLTYLHDVPGADTSVTAKQWNALIRNSGGRSHHASTWLLMPIRFILERSRRCGTLSKALFRQGSK
jgi:hypothetical protein